ncbi:hypothetical protein [Mesorhizobium salmacidum]|uniref:Uncharacterized protein n=1 Tax=Mesorhizobium salmacidum TaxID=3015171 RepID=A0ABU8L313_9HYPH
MPPASFIFSMISAISGGPREKSIFYATSDGRVRYTASGGSEVCDLERFEILYEPTGTFSIFDRYTELPVAVEGRALIGLCRHEVPLALLAAMEPDDSGVPSLSLLSGCRPYEYQRDDLQA